MRHLAACRTKNKTQAKGYFYPFCIFSYIIAKPSFKYSSNSSFLLISQSLHFFYGLGALVSPVIAEPFLRSACADGHFQSNIFGWTLENSTLESYITYNVDGVKFNVTMLNDTISRVSLPRHYRTKSFVQYAYWLVALLQVCVFIPGPRGILPNPGGNPYNCLYRKAPPERSRFLRLQLYSSKYKRVEYSLVKAFQCKKV